MTSILEEYSTSLLRLFVEAFKFLLKHGSHDSLPNSIAKSQPVSSSHVAEPDNCLPKKIPTPVAMTASMKKPSNHLCTHAGSSSPAPSAVLMTLPTSFGIMPLSINAELMTYIPLIWLISKAKLVFVACKIVGMNRAKRWNVCVTAVNEARSIAPESKKEICWAQAAWSSEGYTCRANRAIVCVTGSVSEAVAGLENSVLRVMLIVVVHIRYTQ